MIIKNLDFLKNNTLKIQGGGLKKYYPCSPKAWAYGHIYAMAAGIKKSELISYLKTAAIVDHKKIGAALTYKVSLHAKG